jgi:hypothetical protein
LRVNKNKIGFLSILLIGLISTVFLNINNVENDGLNYISDKDLDDYFSKIQLSSPSDKNWWDSSYKYRTPINITNLHNSDLPKGYSVNTSVDTANLISTGKLRSDGKDLRIVWYNSSSETWLELDRVNDTNFDIADTHIWFKTQASINPSVDDTNYYVYYGNENADDPPTNKSNIYDFYDDFSQSDGPANGWTVTQGTGWFVINNRYRENEAATDRRSILDTYTVENATIEVRITHLGGGATFGGGVMFRYSDGNNFYTSGPGFWGDEVGTGRWTGGAAAQLDGTATSESVLSTDIWYDLRIEMLGNQYYVYLNDSLKNSVTNSDHLNAGQIGFMTWTSNLNVYFDDLKVALLVATSPILTAGTEEVYGSWYNTDWNYHKKITVTTSSATITSDYTVSLTFNHESLVSAGKSLVDGDDIRVVYWNGSDWKELDRMLDSDTSWNSNSTKIWFKTQAAIATSSFDNNYYLYYGNTLAGSPPTNSDNIFFFYDGFESGDLSGWDQNSTGSAGDSIIASTDQAYTGNYAAKCDMDDVASPQAMVYEDFPDEASLFARVHIYLDPSFSTSDRVTVIQFVDTSIVWDNLISVTIDDDMTLYMWNAVVGEAYGYGVGGTISKGSWHTLDVQVNISDSFGVARLWLDGNLEIDNTSIDLGTEPTDRFATGIYWAGDNEFNTLFVDDINLRISIDPEPILTLSAEEALKPSINDFNYYKEIKIDHTKVSGSSNLINFPVLISILDTDLYDKVQSNGNDIAFYNGTHWLDHEIEVFNQTFSGTQAQLVAWVRIPSLSPTTDTKIYMYYGNSTMGPQENPVGVWDANYVGVWHLSEDPTDQILDSTDNDNDGTSYGTMNTGDQISGKVDGSLEFDGIDDYVDCGNNLSLDITGDITIQYWVMAYDVSNDPDTITKGVYTNAYSSFIYNDRTIYFRLNGLSSTSLQSQTSISLDNWVSVTCTRLSNTMRIYINGTQDPTTATFSETIEIITDALTIARSPDNLDGVMDEARLSNIARSGDWIATEYNNQYNPSSFYTVGNDTIAPEITINSPTENDLFGSNAPSYNLTVTDANLGSIWYSLDGGSNSTPVSEIGTIDQTMWSGRPNGTVTIRFYANDTIGNLNYTEVVVRKDISAPAISINSPNTNDLFGTSAPSYDLIVVDGNLDSIWYSLDGGSNSTPVSEIGTINQVMWSGRPNGTVLIRFYANDTIGNLNYSEVVVRKDSTAPAISINSLQIQMIFLGLVLLLMTLPL